MLGGITGGHRTGSGRERRTGSVLGDPARLELVDLTVLQGLASVALVGYQDGPVEKRPVRLLEQALLLRELARRTGRPEALAKAASLAERAARLAAGETRLCAAARLQQATCALDAVQLFADPEGLGAVKAQLDQAERDLGCAPGRLSGPGLLRARIASAEALASGDRAAMGRAAATFEEALGGLEARVRATGSGWPDYALAQGERAELLIGMAARLKDADLLRRVAKELAAFVARLDPAYLPLSWARTETLRASALRALGDATGESRATVEAAAAFGAAMDAIPVGHSPLDRARAAHGLGLTLQELGEATGETRLYASALNAFDGALLDLPPTGLPLRSIAAHDRAACLARQAERNGDVAALAQAEAAFKAELALRTGGADPLAWAVTQVSLARIYEARADLAGDYGDRADAAFALAQALEVFAEHGMRSLSAVALAALDRLKARTRPG